MKLSARNQLKGKVVEVKKGATTAHVRIDIGGGNIVTASITNEFGRRAGLGQRQDRLCHHQGQQRDGGRGLILRLSLPAKAGNPVITAAFAATGSSAFADVDGGV